MGLHGLDRARAMRGAGGLAGSYWDVKISMGRRRFNRARGRSVTVTGRLLWCPVAGGCAYSKKGESRDRETAAL